MLANSSPEQAPPPRVLLLSQRGLSDQVANTCLYELEDLICTMDRVDLVAPTGSAILPGKLYKLARLCGVPSRVARAAILRRHEVAPTRDYPLLLAVLDSYRQVASMQAIKGWRERCDKAICFIPEIWQKDYHSYNAILELFDVFDHVFIGVRHCVDALAAIIGKPCSNLHPAVDALQFCPHPPTPRLIDVCYIGRRSAITHQALLDYAGDRNAFYYYDTAKGGLRVADHGAHRRLFANLIKRSRYFIANYAKIDRPGDTWGAQEVGYRFFEGAAGGAVMLGQAPASADFERLFDWPDAVIDVPFDAPDVADLIAELDADPERLARIRTANVVNTLHRHDWLYRYEDMLAAVGLQPTAEMGQRRHRLLARADRFAHRDQGAGVAEMELHADGAIYHQDRGGRAPAHDPRRHAAVVPMGAVDPQISVEASPGPASVSVVGERR